LYLVPFKGRVFHAFNVKSSLDLANDGVQHSTHDRHV
jgi:hypothetical protein